MASKCHFCDRKGRRQCPAVEGAICPSCCGSKRGTELDCPPECSHYPFGTAAYDLWLKIDEGMVKKLVRYIAEHMKEAEFVRILRRMTPEMGRRGDEEAGSAAATYYALFHHRDESGRTLAERWKEDGWEGLNGDERIMMEYRMDSFVTVIEIRKVLDHHSMESVDLLEEDPEPFLLFDRGMASHVARFSRMLVWLIHYPHFSRPLGVGIELVDHTYEEFMDWLRACTEEEARDRPGFTEKDYLLENYGECMTMPREIGLDNRRRILESIDLHECRAVYTIVGDRGKVEAVLERKLDFQWEDRDPDEGEPEDADRFVWLRRGESKAFEEQMGGIYRHDDEGEGVGILGTVTLAADRLVVETFSKAKFAFAQEMIERYFDDLLELEEESVSDIARQMLQEEKEEKDDDDLLAEMPPRAGPGSPREGGISPEAEREAIEGFHRRQYASFLDEPIPAIDGMTPREAAKEPAMREKLVALMKTHIHGLDRQRRNRGIEVDIDWLLDELGLEDLKG